MPAYLGLHIHAKEGGSCACRILVALCLLLSPAMRRPRRRPRSGPGAGAATATEGLARRSARTNGQAAGTAVADHRRARPLRRHLADSRPDQSGRRGGDHGECAAAGRRPMVDRRDEDAAVRDLHHDHPECRRRRQGCVDGHAIQRRPAGHAWRDRSRVRQRIHAAQPSSATWWCPRPARSSARSSASIAMSRTPP